MTEKDYSVEMVEVTPEMAELWLSYVYFGQRSINEQKFNEYMEMMVNGLWGFGDTMIAIGKVGGSSYLFAGQHRLTAVKRSGKTVLMPRAFYNFASMDDLKKAYAEGTNGGYPFTMQQKLSTLETADAIGVRKTIIRAATTCLGLINTDFQRMERKGILKSAVTVDKYLLFLANNIKAYDNAISGAFNAERLWFERSVVMVVGLITFRFQPEKALQFWESVANNDGLSKNSPEAALRRFISTESSPEANNTFPYVQRVARAWNAFYEGRSLEVLNGGTMTSLRISGTPYNGSQGKVGLSYMFGDK